MRFFQQRVLETRKRAACLGSLIDLGQKHRIVELVDEYESTELHTPTRTSTTRSTQRDARTNQGVVIRDVTNPLEQEEVSRRRRWNRNNRRKVSTMSNPSRTDNIARGLRGGKTPLKGTEIFEWRVKPGKKRSYARDEKTGESQSGSSKEETTSFLTQPPKEVKTATIPRGDEIEPGDTSGQALDTPHTS